MTIEESVRAVMADGKVTRASNSAEDVVLPFLKWAGGKRWLAPLATQIRQAAFGTYIEPFLGSGAMYFGMRPANAVLSDANEDLIETYRALADDWQSVVVNLNRHASQHSVEHYYKVRGQRLLTPATRAARFIYLNRTCWNGLYRVNRQGEFNTPIGSKTAVLLETDDFQATAQLLRSAEILAGDFESQIDRAMAGDLVFADPPYTVRHQHNGFIKYNERLFSWADQVRLHAALQRAVERGATVLCTNADHSSVRELYSEGFTILGMNRFSSIAGKGGSRGRYAEVLILG